MGVCVVEAQDGEGSRPRDQLFAKYTCLEDQMIRLGLAARDVFAAREDARPAGSWAWFRRFPRPITT